MGINVILLKNLCDFADYFNYSIDYVLGLSYTRSNKNLIAQLNLKKLGNNMKKNRTKNKLSQDNVANMLDVTQLVLQNAKKEFSLYLLPTYINLQKNLKYH